LLLLLLLLLLYLSLVWQLLANLARHIAAFILDQVTAKYELQLPLLLLLSLPH